jgi:hypothetical protein
VKICSSTPSIWSSGSRRWRAISISWASSGVPSSARCAWRSWRRLVVADVRRERGDQHQRALHQLGDALAFGSMPRAQCSSKLAHAVAEQPHRSAGSCG